MRALVEECSLAIAHLNQQAGSDHIGDTRPIRGVGQRLIELAFDFRKDQLAPLAPAGFQGIHQAVLCLAPIDGAGQAGVEPKVFARAALHGLDHPTPDACTEAGLHHLRDELAELVGAFPNLLQRAVLQLEPNAGCLLNSLEQLTRFELLSGLFGFHLRAFDGRLRQLGALADLFLQPLKRTFELLAHPSLEMVILRIQCAFGDLEQGGFRLPAAFGLGK